MPKVTVSLTRKVSVEMHDGRWESVEAACAIEDEVPQGTNKESFAAGLRAYVKAVVDDTMVAHKKELMSGGDIGLAEEQVLSGADISTQTGPAIVDELPPLPTEAVEQMPGLAQALDTTEVRTPLDEDTGEELVSFKVDWFMVHESESGSIYAKVHGGTVKKYGASVWGEVMEALVDISDMEPGFRFNPPYPVKAFCTTSDKGFPNKVKFFKRTQ